jgi:hypothetical protein
MAVIGHGRQHLRRHQPDLITERVAAMINERVA